MKMNLNVENNGGKTQKKHIGIICLICGILSIAGFITIFIESCPAITIIIPFVTAPLGIVFGMKMRRSPSVVLIVGTIMNIVSVLLMAGLIAIRILM